MSCKIELIPISEGNRIVVKKDEKIIIGRGSSLGCNDKKISRQHAELLLKNNETLWIKPTHTNPVFYRTSHGKTIQLTKDIEQELKDGDQIGLLPTSFFFRISFSTDTNDNKDKLSTSSDQQSYRSTNNLDSNNHTDIKSTTISSKDTSSKTKSSDVEPKPYIQDTSTSTHVSKQDQNEFESTDSNKTPRKLPTWMIVSTSTSTTASTKTTSNSSCLHDSSSSDLRPTVKRQLNSEEDNHSNTNDLSNTSDIPVTNPSKSSLAKSFDSDSNDGFDSVSTKKIKSNNKHRPVCPYGASCYRKNQMHRTEQSHPGDSDYDDEEQTNNNNKKDDNNVDKPLCPYGKSCYRQNSQHKRDYKH